MKPPAFPTSADARKAQDSWGFNCGPAALCAILYLSPSEIRPFLGDFEEKRYTNPTLLFGVLDRVGVPYSKVYRGDDPGHSWPTLEHGLVRVQWGGRWTNPGVPMRARYRQTHWIGMRAKGQEVFDVNAISVGGWLPFDEWLNDLVPWLCEQCVPGWSGQAWPTHGIEVYP